MISQELGSMVFRSIKASQDLYKMMAAAFFVIGFIIHEPWNQVVWFSGGVMMGIGIYKKLTDRGNN